LFDNPLSLSKIDVSVLTNPIIDGKKAKSSFKTAFDNMERLLAVKSSRYEEAIGQATLRDAFNAVREDFVKNVAYCKA
jgi:hypothetical protein